MEELFENKNRIDTEPASHIDNSFDYLDRSAGDNESVIRKILNDWFSIYPGKEKHELKCRFKDSFTSAFYELFLFKLFRELGFNITVHPEIKNTQKRPDFLMQKSGIEFYLEAKEAKEVSAAQQAQKNRYDQVYDSLNKLKIPNYLLKIDKLILKSDKQPSITKYAEKIENEIAKHDPDLVTNQILKYGLNASPKITLDNSDLMLQLTLIPKDPDKRNDKSRAIGIYPFESNFSGDETYLRKSFSKKANRYGVLDKPYIIGINALSHTFIGDYDINNLIWGSLAVSWSTDPNIDDLNPIRMPDGLFRNTQGSTYKNVSAILITNIMEYNLAVSNYWLIKNPNARQEIDLDKVGLSYESVIDNKISKKAGKSIGEILQISNDWIKL